MSVPTNVARESINGLLYGRVASNLAAQTDARRILQEVHELEENYPRFDLQLSEKVTHIAYSLLSSGCSLIENNESILEGFAALEKAGKILFDAYKFNTNDGNRNYNLLIAGMSLFAAKQYSRAFITLQDINVDFHVGQLIINFIKKDFILLTKITNDVFFTSIPNGGLDILEFDEWYIMREVARCFFIVMDFTLSGKNENMVLINNILDELLYIVKEDCLTLYWMIIRLLKIILLSFRDSSLWNTISPLIPESNLVKKYIRLISFFKTPVTEMWQSQTAALPMALGNNNGAVINLRTSSGKTRVAEIAILKILSDDLMSKVLYLAPFRSLSFEIEQSLNKTFAPLGITVSQLYGGYTASTTDFDLIQNSQIIIATPEKAKALIRCGSGIEDNIKLIVIDEGHLLGANERNIRNEMFFTHIKEFALRNSIKVLLLSAVLPNADELAQWIAGDANLLAKSDWKSSLERLGLLLWDGQRVRLEWKGELESFNPNFVTRKPLGYGSRKNAFPNTKNEAVAATAVRLSQNGTVLIYTAQKRSVNGLANNVLMALGEKPLDYLWPQSEWDIFHSLCEEELPKDDIIYQAARKGIICHSNNLPNSVRIATERLMRSKPPLIIIATSTLGQGVNIGISTVIIHSPYISKDVISKRDFWNICGRAGRAFTDSEGKILYAIDTKETTQRSRWSIRKDYSLANDYFDSQRMNAVESGLYVALNAIMNNSKSANVDFEHLLELIANDSFENNINNEFSKWLCWIFDFIDDELLAMHEEFNINESIDWIDDIFRNSLALIQAKDESEKHIKLLKARTAALLSKFQDKTDRKKVVAFSLPLSVSKMILENYEFFKEITNDFSLSATLFGTPSWLNMLSTFVGKLEQWVNQNAKTILDNIPTQESLDIIRPLWLGGTPLAEINIACAESDSIVKDFYGYTLPWIVNAIAQMFDQDLNKEIHDLYTTTAKLIELGLPDTYATAIYLAGIRSRSTSVELAQTIKFDSVPFLIEIRRILTSLPRDGISEQAQVWLKLFSDTHSVTKGKAYNFPSFTLNREDLPDKLYLRKSLEQYFLTSSDGYFSEPVTPTKELPFDQIANKRGLYFILEENNWVLKSYNPEDSQY